MFYYLAMALGFLIILALVLLLVVWCVASLLLIVCIIRYICGTVTRWKANG